MAKKQKKSKKNGGKKAAEAKNPAETASQSAVVDDMEPLEATAANDTATLEAETATEAAATPVNPSTWRRLRRWATPIIAARLFYAAR